MATHTLNIHVLGSPNIFIDDKPLIGFVSSKAQALLIYLALNPQPHQRSFLVQLLWSESTESDGRTSLRSVLTNLKKLAGRWLEITRSTITFRTELPHHIDLSDLDTADSLDSYLQLLNGEFLEGLAIKDAEPFERWLQQTRDDLRKKISARLIHELASTPQRETRQRIITHLLRVDPWHEDGHLEKMRDLALHGRETEALHVADQFYSLARAEKLPIPPAISQLEERIKTRQAKSSLHNIPPDRTPFIGRDEDLVHLQEVFSQPTNRLVTLFGFGGQGKTRLAQAFGRIAPTLFIEGAIWVPLAAVTTLGGIYEAISTAAQQSISAQFGTAEGLVDWLANKELLLILDNVEQLASQSPRIGQLLDQLPQLRILVTSRELLNLYDEIVFDVSGLAYPAQADEQPSSYPATDLFNTIAQRINRSFQIDSHFPVVQEICQLVDGIPLALELAASTMRQRTPSELVSHLRQEPAALTTPFRNLPERHQSLRAVFDYSWALLTPSEKELLMRLAVCIGGFTSDAAEAIGKSDPKTVQALIDQSLIQVDADGRYSQHELIRQFAAQELEAYNLLPESRQDHLAYYTQNFAQAYIDAQYMLTNTLIPLVTADIENLVQARAYALEIQALDELHKLSRLTKHFGDLRGRFRQALRFFEYAAEQLKQVSSPTARHLHALTLSYQGFFLERIDQYQDALELLHQSQVLFKESKQNNALALRDYVGVLNHIGMILYQTDQTNEAKRYFLEAVQESHELPPSSDQALAYGRLGMIASIQGEYEEALQYIQQSIVQQKALGNDRGVAISRYELGQLYRTLGRYPEAQEIYEQAYTYLEGIGEIFGKTMTLHRLGEVAREQDQFEQARDYLKQGLQIADEQLGRSQAVAMFTLSLGLVELEDNQQEAASGWLLRTQELVETNQFLRMGAVATAALGSLRYQQNDMAVAQSLFTQSVSWLRQLETPPLNLLVFSYFTSWLWDQQAKELVQRLLSTMVTHASSPAWIKEEGGAQLKRLNLTPHSHEESIEALTEELQAILAKAVT